MVKELFEIMENLNNNLEHLLIVSRDKRKAIVQRDLEGLEASIKSEEKLLNEIHKLENSRLGILKSFNSDEPVDEKEKVDLLMNKISSELPEKLSEHLSYLRNKMKEVSRHIKSVNQQNMFLIESSREVLRMLFSELKGNKESFMVNRKV